MTKEEYLDSLRSALEEKKIENYEEIIIKYEKRFILADNAGLTVDEAIKMLGSVESVVYKYSNKGEQINYSYIDSYSLQIDDALSEEIIIEKGSKEGIVINIDECLMGKIEIKNDNKKITIFDKITKALFKSKKGTIRIEIGPNVKFKVLKIKMVNQNLNICDVFVDDFDIQDVNGDIEISKLDGRSFNISTINGDVSIERIKCDEVKFSSVNGDIDVNFITANIATFDTIRGDINVTGKILKRHGHAITGDINYTEIN